MSKRSKDRQYRLWRVHVIRRDKCCVLCGSTERRAAHHLNDWSNHPTLRYDESNGVCLCGKCHVQFHTNFKRSFRCKCTKYDFDNFTCLAEYFMALQ